MINKEYPIKPPFPVEMNVSVFGKPAQASGKVKDDKIVIIEKLFDKLYRESLQIRISTYSGTGKAQTITTGINSQVVFILKNVDLGTYTDTVAGEMAVASNVNEGVTFITGVGYVNDGITDFINDGFVIGANSNINTENGTYLYIAVG